MEDRKVRTVPFVVETSYEIVHKVGGVQTVVKTKAPEMTRHYRNNFLMLGPIIPGDDAYSTVFDDQRAGNKEMDELLTGFERTFEFPQGCCRYGEWLVPGAPKVVLLPVSDFNEKQNALRHVGIDLLNRKMQVDLFNTPQDCKEQFRTNAVNFGIMQWAFLSYLLPEFIQKKSEQQTTADETVKYTLIYQTHEWLAGYGLILMKITNAYDALNKPHGYWRSDAFKSVFTTHATTIGRHLSAGGVSLNNLFTAELSDSFADAEANKRGVVIEHRCEACAAQCADKLTTVSTITGQECKYFLRREPDAITWNGLDVNSQKGMIDDNELQSTHKTDREKIMDFVRSYFYGIDPSKTQIFFTAGRNEYQNKGIDLFIDALAKLRDRLDDKSGSGAQIDKTVVAFIIAPQDNTGFNEHALTCVSLEKEVKLYTEQLGQQVGKNLLKAIGEVGTDVKHLQMKDLVSTTDLITLKRFQQQLQRNGMFSPITTNNICDQNCPILSQLRARGLTNEGLTRVKVIFVPQFLTKTSIFGMDYKEFVRGAHLGVFASLYEPFGYTSPECMCVGTASVVSNLCGCGNLFEKTQKELGREDDLIKRMEDMHRASSSNLLAMGQLSDLGRAAGSPRPEPTGNAWVEN